MVGKVKCRHSLGTKKNNQIAMYLRHNVRSVSLLSIVRSVETPDEKKVGFLSSDYLTWISPKSFFYVRKRMIKRPKKKWFHRFCFSNKCFWNMILWRFWSLDWLSATRLEPVTFFLADRRSSIEIPGPVRLKVHTHYTSQWFLVILGDPNKITFRHQ